MDPVTKSLIAAVQEVQEATYGSPKPEKKDTRLTVTAADKKANTKAYQNYKAGNKAYKAADHLKEAGKEPRWQDDDCDGKWYEKSDVDGKISKREKKAKEKAYAKEDVEVVEKLVESGKFTDEEIVSITNIQEADIADILAQLEKKRIRQGGDPDKSPLGKKTGRAMKAQQDKQRKKAGLKTEHHEKDADGNVIPHEEEDAKK